MIIHIFSCLLIDIANIIVYVESIYLSIFYYKS